VAVGAFFLVHALPGDVISAKLAEGGASQAQITAAREELGLDKPLPEQFFDWMGGAVRLDFGKSLFTNRSISENIRKSLTPSLELAVPAMALGLLLGSALGAVSAVKASTPLDYLARILAVIGIAVPDFFLGVLVILAMSQWLDYFPPLGFVPIWDDPLLSLEQVWIPMVLLSIRLSATTSRLMRATLLGVLRSDYIRTARSKGLSGPRVVFRHGLKNAFPPVLTIAGSQAGTLLAGTVIMEVLFNLPGFGLLTFNAVVRRDYPQIQANILVLATVVLLINLLVDLSYPLMDPRIRRA
jgi:peptide/nickel transport system permease protein